MANTQSKNVKGKDLKYKVNLREDRNKLKGKHLKPKVKETAEIDDDMAFLDSVVQLNQLCAFEQCPVNISEISFNACRTC